MIWRLLLTNRLVRTIGLVLAGVLSFLTFGALNVRKGRLKERADAALREAKANAKNERDRNEIDRDASGADARDRLRADWTRD